MFKKDRNILNEIVRDLTGERYILKIIVFGSRVRDDNRGDSDLDILVIVERKERKIKDKIREIFFEYELKYEISFGLIILSLEEWEINKKWVVLLLRM